MNKDALISKDIEAYLRKHQAKDLLRLIAAGSVDDGKSTLIGRLLYDAKVIYEDQLAALKEDSVTHGTTGTDFDPALLTDGLIAEREQGITIDVAYRYFSTKKRNFIIADCPGHQQYTRNMATGASNCNLAIILIDARNGVIEQTKRHSFISRLLGIRHLVVCINKMDLVDYSEDVFEQIRTDYEDFAARLEATEINFIPISALEGDNVVDRSEHMPWYTGAPLLRHLENVSIVSDQNLIDLRYPVQYVARPDPDFRGFAGTVASGIIRKGDEILAMPSRQTSQVKSINTFEGEIDEAFPPMAVMITLDDEIDLSRGDMIVHPNNLPRLEAEFDAMVVWMNDKALEVGRVYTFKSATTTVPGRVDSIQYAINVNTLHREEQSELMVNDIGRVSIKLQKPLCHDPYSKNRTTGSLIIIDRVNNLTLGAGMIIERGARATKPATEVSKAAEPTSKNIREEASLVGAAEREALLKQKPVTIWLTGLSGSGKSTISQALEERLVQSGQAAYVLDGDNVRHGLNRDLGFSAAERTENIRRIAEVARLMNQAGLIAISSFISPFAKDRMGAKEIIGNDRFIEVFVDTPLEVCEQRDPKGLYKKARSGEIQGFTGISAPYEAPKNPDLCLDTTRFEVEASVQAIIAMMRDRGLIT
ncbi:MAG: sulfate adenylyltransferase subunit CysN [Verrucomicrobiota bacterium]